MIAKGVDVECYTVEGGVVLYDKDGAFSDLNGGEEIEVGYFEDTSKTPAAGPLLGGGVEEWRRERREKMMVVRAVRFPFTLKFGVPGIKFQIKEEHVAPR